MREIHPSVHVHVTLPNVLIGDKKEENKVCVCVCVSICKYTLQKRELIKILNIPSTNTKFYQAKKWKIEKFLSTRNLLSLVLLIKSDVIN